MRVFLRGLLGAGLLMAAGAFIGGDMVLRASWRRRTLVFELQGEGGGVLMVRRVRTGEGRPVHADVLNQLGHGERIALNQFAIEAAMAGQELDGEVRGVSPRRCAA